jgi:hypothetical protein
MGTQQVCCPWYKLYKFTLSPNKIGWLQSYTLIETQQYRSPLYMNAESDVQTCSNSSWVMWTIFHASHADGRTDGQTHTGARLSLLSLERFNFQTGNFSGLHVKFCKCFVFWTEHLGPRDNKRRRLVALSDRAAAAVMLVTKDPSVRPSTLCRLPVRCGSAATYETRYKTVPLTVWQFITFPPQEHLKIELRHSRALSGHKDLCSCHFFVFSVPERKKLVELTVCAWNSPYALVRIQSTHKI